VDLRSYGLGLRLNTPVMQKHACTPLSSLQRDHPTQPQNPKPHCTVLYCTVLYCTVLHCALTEAMNVNEGVQPTHAGECRSCKPSESKK